MTIYVDNLQWYPGSGARFGGRGKWWCHMITDGEIEELHEFAEEIGLKRAWFQDHPTHPHYDLTESRQIRAVAAGAKLVTSLELVKILKAKGGEG
jgi:alkanesulfonate monooxygenase SsuD/methylene tetrahydromethanopterin reductase-like flavin-dependent oxidoreductase (luciferase family)